MLFTDAAENECNGSYKDYWCSMRHPLPVKDVFGLGQEVTTGGTV